jgi:hypothetical protein
VGPAVVLESAQAGKLLRLATVIGKDSLKALGFADREAFVTAQIKTSQLSP